MKDYIPELIIYFELPKYKQKGLPAKPTHSHTSRYTHTEAVYHIIKICTARYSYKISFYT